MCDTVAGDVCVYVCLLYYSVIPFFIFPTGYGVEQTAFNLSYDDVTYMWHQIPHRGISVLSNGSSYGGVGGGGIGGHGLASCGVENIIHSTPYGITTTRLPSTATAALPLPTPTQCQTQTICLCDTCMSCNSRYTTKRLQSTTLLQPTTNTSTTAYTIGLGDIKNLTKQGWWFFSYDFVC